jgi:hypothetical protein
MASKLKRRIPVIFSGVGASAGSASVASVGVANIPPSWTDALGDSFSITAGVPFSYTFTAYDPNPGDLIDFIQNSVSAGLTVTENDQSGLYRTITISSSTGLAAGTYTASLDLDETTVEVDDWLSRSTGAGVVWAHNFEHENEVLNFLIAPKVAGVGKANDPAREWEATHHPLDVNWDSADGFAGGGSLKITVPAADVAFERSYGQADDAFVGDETWLVALKNAFGTSTPGIPFGRGLWSRPYSPLTTDGTVYRGNGTGQADINRPGITYQQWRPWVAEAGSAARSTRNNFKAGVYGHASYTPPTGWTREGSEFYLQYRMKIPFNRFYSTRMLPAYTGQPGARFFTTASPYRARQSAQKYAWISSLTTGTPNQEIALSGFPQLRIADGNPYDTPGTTSFHKLYTNYGPEFFNSFSNYTIDADVWVTYLYHVIWGRNGVNESTVEMFVSVNGAAYTTIGSVTNWPMAYEVGGPFGCNTFEPTAYTNFTDNTNGGSNASIAAAQLAAARDQSTWYSADGVRVATGETYDIRVTQVIFSTQYIPPPAVGA